ncbi:hypothetical protein BC830DRAFT_1095076 [Chytriomyces sp. MP71]|nr:hypothetical protein BC830DRAFT_1095076 [Chytriomyces sp. MP71]
MIDPVAGPGLRNKASMTFAQLATQLKPLQSDAAKRISMGVQFAKERFNPTGTDVTELPPKYRDLEAQVDRVKHLHESLLKLTVNYQKMHYDYQPALSETAKDVAASVREGWSSLIAGTPASPTGQGKEEIPPSLSHAFGRAARSASVGMEGQDPATVALTKFADSFDAVGEARLKMDAEITRQVHTPLQLTLNTTLAHAVKARRQVTMVRLNYDSARAKLKTAKPSQEEAARAEMEATEDAFVQAVDDAMNKMSAVVGSGEVLRSLTELVKAQLEFYKKAHEAMSELLPEMEELTLTSEALKGQVN